MLLMTDLTLFPPPPPPPPPLSPVPFLPPSLRALSLQRAIGHRGLAFMLSAVTTAERGKVGGGVGGWVVSVIPSALSLVVRRKDGENQSPHLSLERQLSPSVSSG